MRTSVLRLIAILWVPSRNGQRHLLYIIPAWNP